MDKKQREERRRQEDIALQRGLLWVVGAIVLEGLLILVNRYYINYSMNESSIAVSIAFGNVLRLLRVILPVAAAAALGWTVWQVKQKKSFHLPLILALALAAVSICTHVAVKFQREGMSMLFWLVIAWAVLALVFYIYQREFFLAACACGMSVLGLWFVRTGIAGRWESILVLLAIAVVTAAALCLKKTDGVAASIRVLAKGASYTVPLVTCLVSLAAVLAGLFLGNTIAYYLMFVMVAWLFALFVYYTVKLM